MPAGQALAVDREIFSKRVTEEIKKNELIEIIRKQVISHESNENEEQDQVYLEDLIKEGIVIIATGPLTSNSLSKGIKELTGSTELHFYDAAAPIVEKDSIDFNIAFYGDRYDQEKKKEESIEEWHNRLKEEKNYSYINLPMNKEEYEKLYNELINAEVTNLHEFEKGDIFEGCMPVEIMAKRGIDTLRYGPLKPVGFDDPRTGKRPYALVQLRQDNSKATMYNIVGFQTNLKFGEQNRVFKMIPGLQNGEFIKYGVMHRNTFINSPKLLDNTYNFKKNNNIFFAGQITGVEGYVESISSGLVAGINASLKYITCQTENSKNNIKETKTSKKINDASLEKLEFSDKTMIGALAKYISSPNDEFQPMNANFGIIPELEEDKIKDKKKRYQKLSDRALSELKNEAPFI